MLSVGIWRAPAPGSSRTAWPSRNERPVGIHRFPFEACSSFTHVTARRFARPPIVDFCHEAPIPAVTRRSGSLAIQVYRHLLGVGLSPTGDLRRWGARSFCNFACGGKGRDILAERCGKAFVHDGVGLQHLQLFEATMEGALDAGVVAGETVELVWRSWLARRSCRWRQRRTLGFIRRMR